MRVPVFLVVAASSDAVAAQASGRTGLAFGLRAQSAGVGTVNPNGPHPEQTGSEGGLGAEATAAYGFSDRLTAFASLGGARVEGDDPGVLEGDSYRLGTGDLGVRLKGRPSERLNPYGVVAVTGLAATSSGAGALGGGFTFGGGADLRISRALFLDLGLSLTLGQFVEFSAEGGEGGAENADAALARVGFGLRYTP